MDDYLNQTALYFQVKENIKALIKNERLKQGDKLPTEKEFMEKYRVSRITLRRALDELEHENYIKRIHGKGTFVSRLSIQSELSNMRSFTEDMKARGFQTYSKVLESKVVNAPEEAVTALRLSEGMRVILIKRIRYADNSAVALEECYLPVEDFAGIVDEDLASQSLNELMVKKYGVKFSYADQYIKPGIPDKKLKELLSLKKSVPILYMKRIAFDQTGRAVQLTYSSYRGDIYEYKVILSIDNKL